MIICYYDNKNIAKEMHRHVQIVNSVTADITYRKRQL